MIFLSVQMRDYLPNSIRMKFCSLFILYPQPGSKSQFQICLDCGLGSIKMEFLAVACKGFHPSYTTLHSSPLKQPGWSGVWGMWEDEYELLSSYHYDFPACCKAHREPLCTCQTQFWSAHSWVCHHDPTKCVFGEKGVPCSWWFCCGSGQNPGI